MRARVSHVPAFVRQWLLIIALFQLVTCDLNADDFTFRHVASMPTSYDDNFRHAVVAVSAEQTALIARNYMRVGSPQQINWLRDHPERRGNRLFTRNAENDEPTHLTDSTTFGFIPNSSLAYALICNGRIYFWDTESKRKLTTELTHDVASECAGPGPAVSPDGKLIATQTMDALQLWHVPSFERAAGDVEKNWSRDMAFSSDGLFLFHREKHQLSVRNAKSGQLIVAPFRHDLICKGFCYSAESQRIVTIENSSQKEAEWSSTAVIRSIADGSELNRVVLPAISREAMWLSPNQILVVADEKHSDRQPPYTYGRNSVYMISLKGNDASISLIDRHSWIRNLKVNQGSQSYIVQTRDWTNCRKIDESAPVWARSPSEYAAFGDGNWVLLQHGRTAIVCSLTDGKELRRWNDVELSRVDGPSIWLLRNENADVWHVETRKPTP